MALDALETLCVLIDFDRLVERLTQSLRLDPLIRPSGLGERAMRIASEFLDQDLDRFNRLHAGSYLSPAAEADYAFLTGTFGTPPASALERVVRFNSQALLPRRIFVMLALRGESPDNLEGQLGVSTEQAGPLFREAVLTILGREGDDA